MRLEKENGMAVPTINKKRGITRSQAANPSQATCVLCFTSHSGLRS
ncbi:unknown [Akkermansia muciniphila CAG:154]|nr:unknown [Akkermansia muciniphila CAG:154]